MVMTFQNGNTTSGKEKIFLLLPFFFLFPKENRYLCGVLFD